MKQRIIKGQRGLPGGFPQQYMYGADPIYYATLPGVKNGLSEKQKYQLAKDVAITRFTDIIGNTAGAGILNGIRQAVQRIRNAAFTANKSVNTVGKKVIQNVKNLPNSKLVSSGGNLVESQAQVPGSRMHALKFTTPLNLEQGMYDTARAARSANLNGSEILRDTQYLYGPVKTAQGAGYGYVVNDMFNFDKD